MSCELFAAVGDGLYRDKAVSSRVGVRLFQNEAAADIVLKCNQA
jgi:hypothetical protein